MNYDIKIHSYYRSSVINEQKQEVLNSTEEKTLSVFSRIYDSLLTVYYFIKSSLSFPSHIKESLYNGRQITDAQNTGKAEDAHKYVDLARNPGFIDQNTRSKITERGYDTDYISRLSPIPLDRGKCTGGVTLFLKKALSDPENIETHAKNFMEGVPLEGVLHQELYNKLGIGIETSDNLFVIWGQIPEKNLNNILKSDIQIDLDYTPSDAREVRIILGFIEYLRLKDFSVDLLQFVNNYIQTNKPDARQLEGNNRSEDLCKPLDRGEKASLYNFESSVLYGVHSRERLALEIKGLDFHPKYTTLTGATAIIDYLPKLDPGAYKLSFPVHGYFGQYVGSHTIACFVKEEGSTIFYDPNFTVSEVEGMKRKETVERVFKHYSRSFSPGRNIFGKEIYGFKLFKVISK